jgi:two-component system, cell cycle sensor histidine kinase PleC
MAQELAVSKAEMLTALTHDLRTPLNAVIGFSDVMHRELLGPLGNDRYRDYAVHIRDSGEQLLATAERLVQQNRCPQGRRQTG